MNERLIHIWFLNCMAKGFVFSIDSMPVIMEVNHEALFGEKDVIQT